MNIELNKVKIGFIGAGQMAQARARGVVEAKMVAGDSIDAFDPSEETLKHFCQSVPSAHAADDNLQLVDAVEVIILAVKPQVMPVVLSQIKDRVTDGHLIISIAAGVTTETIAQGLNQTGRIIRVMPNTPCLVTKSASAYCLGPKSNQQDSKLVHQLLSAVGTVFELQEKMMDAVTGLSGSGPAFVYLIIEALSDAGVKVGLPRDVSSALAAQTVLGAAQMVISTGQHPSVLKDSVTSPGGTTIAGLQKLEESAVRAAFIQAVQAATARSVELGNQ